MDYNIYHRNYKWYILVPLILFIIFAFLIAVYPKIPTGIDLKGGTIIIVRSTKQIDAPKLEQILNNEFQLSDLKVNAVSSPSGFGIVIQYAENVPLAKAQTQLNQAKQLEKTDPTQAKTLALEAIDLVKPFFVPEKVPENLTDLLLVAQDSIDSARENFSAKLQQTIASEFGLDEKELMFQLREVGPSLGKAFFDSAITVAITGFILITIIIFLFFRQVVPSLAIIASAIFDIAGAMALMAVFNIPLGLSSIPALLMLIGYSVDTDILLTTRIMKRTEKTARDRAFESMKTGLTMTFTTISAVSAMLIFSYLNQITVIFEIAAVLLFGLIWDLIGTWSMNAGLLLWFFERKKKKKVSY